MLLCVIRMKVNEWGWLEALLTELVIDEVSRSLEGLLQFLLSSKCLGLIYYVAHLSHLIQYALQVSFLFPVTTVSLSCVNCVNRQLETFWVFQVFWGHQRSEGH